MVSAVRDMRLNSGAKGVGLALSLGRRHGLVRQLVSGD
jgi:hypothetical protein